MTYRRIRSLQIPEDEQGTLANVLRLKDPDLGGLEQALARVTPTLDKRKLMSDLRSDQVLANIADLEGIVGSLINIVSTAYSAGVDVDQILDAVITSIREDEVVDLGAADGEILKSRLMRLAKSRSIELIAKGSELLQTNERTFQSARIISDLRMVCSGNETDVAAAVVVHQLALTTYHNNESETIFITLDSLDLESLKGTIIRAAAKDRSLREYANRAGTPVMSPIAQKE